MATIWVLLESYNDYDRRGDYFVTAWTRKPNADQLRKYVNEDNFEEEVAHLLAGGGRVNYEDGWYTLTSIKEGE